MCRCVPVASFPDVLSIAFIVFHSSYVKDLNVIHCSAADSDNLSDAVSFIKSSERDNEEGIKLKQLLHRDTDSSLGGSCGCISQFSGPRFGSLHLLPVSLSFSQWFPKAGKKQKNDPKL